MADQSDAAKRAAARKAKILARGNTGLQKLAQTARGEEAEKLYGDVPASSSRPDTPSSPPASGPKSTYSGPSGPSWVPPTSSSTGGAQGQARRPMDPSQQQMADQLQAMMSMLGGGPGGPGGMGEEGAGMPDMSRLLSQMMSGMGGMGDNSGRMPNLLGDLDDPAGLGGLPPGFPPPGMNMPGFPFGPNNGAAGSPGKSWVDKLWPLVHAISITIFVGMVVLWWEPTLRNVRLGGEVLDVVGGGWSGRWSRLSGRRGFVTAAKEGLLGSVEIVPVFWAFTTIELILQTTRFFILRSPPPPHSLIQTFLPLLPPAISKPVITGSRYLSMLSQLYKDGCLLVFLVGMVVVLADYAYGRTLLG